VEGHLRGIDVVDGRYTPGSSAIRLQTCQAIPARSRGSRNTTAALQRFDDLGRAYDGHDAARPLAPFSSSGPTAMAASAAGARRACASRRALASEIGVGAAAHSHERHQHGRTARHRHHRVDVEAGGTLDIVRLRQPCSTR